MKYFYKMAIVAGALLLPSLLFAQETTTATDSSSGQNAATSPGLSLKDPAAPVGGAKSENLFKNGDFTHERTGWKTHGKVVDADEHTKALEISLKSKTPEIISTTIHPDSNTRVIVVSFKAKATNDDGSPMKTGVDVRILNPKENLFYYWKLQVKDSSDWQTFQIRYDVSRFCTELFCEFEPKGGSGKIDLADFYAEEIKK